MHCLALISGERLATYSATDSYIMIHASLGAAFTTDCGFFTTDRFSNRGVIYCIHRNTF